MDLRTGRTYETREEALADGVPDSDIAKVSTCVNGHEIVTFSSGPFKGRVYQRTDEGHLVRIDKGATR